MGRTSTRRTSPTPSGEAPRWARRAATATLTAALALAMAACNDPQEPLRLAAIEIVSGDSQEGKICTELAEPLVVRALNQFGDLLPGAMVRFSTESGSVSPASSIADANGTARTTFTLGSNPGTYTVTATAWHGTLIREFTANGLPDPPHVLRRISGHNQSATAGTQLANVLLVRVLDACDVPIPDVAVHWSTESTGQLSATETVTDSTGHTSIAFVVPSEPGSVIVTAAVDGVGSVNFTAHATAPAEP